MDRKMAGIVFNIQKYSVHDGPGIRTVVFMKGCPLQCTWCSNPESQNFRPELAFNENKCLTAQKCNMCLEVCESGALSKTADNQVEHDRQVCRHCFLCADVCPSMALNVYGQTITVDEILKAVEEDSAFYARSGGGLTLGGGDPMFQPEFAAAVLKEARRRRIDTTMETCGYCETTHLEEACQYLNTLIFDIKSLDGEKHKRFTGVSNARIIDNFTNIRTNFPKLEIVVRTPVVPGFNDSVPDIMEILYFLQDKSYVTYELLPYHRFGLPKYAYLGREYTGPGHNEIISKKKMEALQVLVGEGS